MKYTFTVMNMREKIWFPYPKGLEIQKQLLRIF